MSSQGQCTMISARSSSGVARETSSFAHQCNLCRIRKANVPRNSKLNDTRVVDQRETVPRKAWRPAVLFYKQSAV